MNLIRRSILDWIMMYWTHSNTFDKNGYLACTTTAITFPTTRFLFGKWSKDDLKHVYQMCLEKFGKCLLCKMKGYISFFRYKDKKSEKKLTQGKFRFHEEGLKMVSLALSKRVVISNQMPSSSQYIMEAFVRMRQD